MANCQAVEKFDGKSYTASRSRIQLLPATKFVKKKDIHMRCHSGGRSGGVNARLFLFHYRCYFPLIFRRQTNKQRKSAKNSQSWRMAAGKKTNRKRKSPLQGALQTKLQNFGAYSSLPFGANCFLLMPKRENKTLSASPVSDFWLRLGQGRGLGH